MKKVLSLLLVLCIVTTLAGCNLLGDGGTLPVLNGDSDITIEVGTTYTEEGTTAVPDDVTITGTVDTNVIGDYTITFDVVVDDSTTVTLTKTVHVVDTTIPVITLIDGDMTIAIGDPFVDPGATAMDNYDNDITTNIIVSGAVDTSLAGTYTLNYDISDSSNNSALTMERIITVTADAVTNIPVITLIGDASITVTQGNTFADPGATAIDTEDGDISTNLDIINPVDTSTLGTYIITYNITDSDGLVALEVTRTVTVEAYVNQAPVITLIGNSIIVVSKGGTYTDEGATALDFENGDLPTSIVTVNPVDTTIQGSYIITYNVMDNDGLAATEVTRTVVVDDGPTITLIGQDVVTIDEDSVYIDAGATALDVEDGDLTTSITIVNPVDTSVPGTFTVTYNVVDSNGESALEVTRTVIVKALNDVPVITLIGDPSITIYVGSLYTDAGATALDAQDGDITANIVIVSTVNVNIAGSYTVTYNIEDSLNVAAIEVVRTVTVVTNNIPVLSINGDESIIISLNSVYIDEGATVLDTEDGDITSDIVTLNPVDTSVEGDYEVTYTITDSDGNEVTATRYVMVVDSNTKPTIVLVGDSEITVTLGVPYVDEGATAFDTEDGDVTTDLVINNTVNVNVVGIYYVSFNVVDSNGLVADEIVRTVSVLSVGTNTNPIISLIGDADIHLDQGMPYIEQGAIAFDAEEGDISEYIGIVEDIDTSIPGEYVILYYVYDYVGNYISVNRTVTVDAFTNTDPTITLLGDSSIFLDEGDLYIELGATAADAEDGDITGNISVSGTVDTSKSGVYILRYMITDQHNSTVTVTRTVVVLYNNRPVITVLGEEMVYINVGDIYNDAGATATDAEDGVITSDITVSTDLTPTIPGIYEINYTVYDSQGKAEFISRLVIVQNNTGARYETVIIERGLDVDFPSLLVDLELASTFTITLDTNVVGNTYYKFGDIGVLFKVVEPGTMNTVIEPSTIIIKGSYHSSYRLLLLDRELIEVTSSNIRETEFSIGIGYMESLLSLSTRNTEMSEQVLLEKGIYDTFSFTMDPMIETYKIYIDSLGIPTSTTFEADPKGFTNTIIDEQVQDFTFTSIGSEYEIVVHSWSEFTVTLTNSAGTVIASDTSTMAQYRGHTFRLIETLPLGDYTVSVAFSNDPEKLSVYINNEVQAENYGYIYAEALSVDTETTLDLLPGRAWYSLSIPESGYYNFDLLYSNIQYLDFTLYTHNLGEVSYASNYIYLETGSYFLSFNDSGLGRMTFKISIDTEVITSNNSKSESLDIQINSLTTTYFDDINTEKWFEFTLTQEQIIQFTINNKYQLTSNGITLYTVNDDVLFMDESHIQMKLEAGTYYIKTTGVPSSAFEFALKEIDSSYLTPNEATPIIINEGELLGQFLHDEESQFYQFTVTNETIYQFIYQGSSQTMISIFNGEELISEMHLDSDMLSTIKLQAATYRFVITASSGNTTYNLVVSNADHAFFGFSDNANEAPVLDIDKIQQAYVDSSNTVVYQRIIVDQATMIFGHLEGVESVVVYDNQGHIIRQGNAYAVFPGLFEPGEYLIAYTSYGQGLVRFMEIWTEIAMDYGKDFDTVTTITGNPILKGYQTEDTVDTILFTVDEYTVYHLSSGGQYFLMLLNEDEDVLANMSPFDYDIYVALEPGTYYLVINTEPGYYELWANNVTPLIAGDSFATAQEVYVQTMKRGIALDNYTDSYYYFTILEDAYLQFSLNGDYFNYEIYDSNHELYNALVFDVGTYYIKIQTGETNCYSACDPRGFDFKITNINSKIINNTMLTAISINEGGYIEGIVPPSYGELWYKFEHTNNIVLQLYTYNGSHLLTFFDSDGTEIDIQANTLYEFAPGTFYARLKMVELENNPPFEEFSFNINFWDYTDAPATISNSVEIVLGESGNASFSSFTTASTDIDMYKFVVEGTMLLDFNSYNVNLALVDETGAYIKDLYGETLYFTDTTIYIKATSYGFNQYTITITDFTSFIPGTNSTDAKIIGFNTMVNAFDAGITGGTDYFKFTLPRDGMIGLWETSKSYEVYDMQANLMPLNESMAAGDYFIVFPTDGYQHTYRFRIKLMEETQETTPENSLELISNTMDTPLVINGIFFTLEYAYSGNGDQDFFELVVEEGTFYTIRNNTWNSVSIYIYDENGVMVTDGMYLNSIDVYLYPGTYLIRVEDAYMSYNVSFNEYKYIDYVTDANNPYELFVYEHIESYLFESGEQVWFEFDITTAGLYNIITNGTIGFELYDSSNTLVTSSNEGKFIDLAVGTYTIKLSNLSTVWSEYSLKILNVTEYVITTVMTDAVTVDLLKGVNFVEYYSDGLNTHYVKLVLTQDTIISFYKDATIYSSNGLVYTADIFTPGTYYIGLDDNYEGIFLLYYREITDLVFSDTSFTPFTLEEKVIGYGEYNTEDTFTLTLTNDTLVGFKMIDVDNMFIEITDSSSNLVFGEWVYRSNYTQLFYLRANETYTVTVKNVSGLYSFELLEIPSVDAPDTSETAQAITLVEIINTKVFDSTDEDWYTITLTESATITVPSLVTFEINDGTTSTIYNQETSVTLAAGTYTFKVTASTIERYEFVVEEIVIT